MIKTPNSWKKFAIYLIFSLPASLVGQDSQFLSKTTSAEAVRNSSSQPGDILTSTPFTGNRKILFISFKYPGDASGIVSTSELQSDAVLVENSIERNSYDKVSLTIDITPTLTMPNPPSYYLAGHPSTRMRADAAKVAAQAGFDVDSYDREILFGRPILGGIKAFGTLNRRTAIMNQDAEDIMVHELGHTFGWRHTNFWEVQGGSPISSEGIEEDYGDRYDMMAVRGAKPPYPASIWHHFNPWLKYRNGWISDESILNVTDSGTYTIQALDSDPMTGTSVTKYTALKIRKDPFTEYWIFYRSLEEFINYGPVITRIFNTNIYRTHLLDMTPGSQNDDWKDAALPVGQTFSDTLAGISVKALSVASLSEVQVEVTVDANALASMDNLPLIDVVNPPSGQTIEGTVDYLVTAFDPDFGNNDGAGIDKVTLWLHHATDAAIYNLQMGLDPPTPVATQEFSAPPYHLQVDTNSLPGLQTRAYFLVAKANSLDGGTRTVWFEHLIDTESLPAAPALSSPSDNATGISTNPTLLWSSSSAATSYHVQLSTLSDFSTSVVDQSGLTSTSLQVSGLANNTIYYWRVNATNANGTSPYSTVWQFTTIIAAPAAPALSSPADNATDISTAPTLVWSASSGAIYYDVQVSAQSNFATLEVDQSGLSVTSLQATGFSNSTTHYWRVRATNAGGTSPWSTVWQFTTIIAGPAVPVLSSPSDNGTDVPINPTLEWNEAEKATTYQLQLSTNSNFSAPIVDQSGIATTSFQVPGLLNNTIYFWRVRAANAGGTSDWSSVRHFTTIVAVPAAPVLSSPADNAINLPVDLTLEWNDVSGAVSYQVQVSTQSDFSTGLMGRSGLTLTSFQVSGLADETTYFWRVNATNAGGTGPWSPVRQFTTEPVSSVETGSEIPADFRLGQNYPNPFNPTTNIAFDLPKSEFVSLKIYNLLGTEVATLVSENLSAGKYTIKFDASSLSSGVFFYKLQTTSFVETRKMLLVR